MSESFLKWLKHAVTGYLVAVPVVVLFGLLFPWPAGQQALSRYPDQTPIMITYFSHSKVWRNARSGVWVTRKNETRSYVLFPSVFNNPRIVTVSRTGDNEPTVSESSAPLTLVAMAGLFAFAAFGAWYFWIRSPRQYELSPDVAKTLYGSQSSQREFGRRIS
jgi:hypothetical protein